MRALKVEFAARKPVPQWLWVVATLAFGALALHQGWQAWALQERVTALRGEADALATEQVERSTQARRETAGRVRVEPAYARDAAAIAKIARFPLDRVLVSLESAQVQGVKVTSLELSAVEATARAELEFADHAALLNYLEAINAGEPQPRWALMRAQMAPSPGGPNVASISSSWSSPDR
jgi:hypothetical protein